MVLHTLFLCSLLLALGAAGGQPVIRVVHPPRGGSLDDGGQVFVTGSVRPHDAPLTVNGQPVTPWRTGGFLCMVKTVPGTNTLVLRAGDTELRHTFRVRAPAPAWDGRSLRAQAPLRPLGVITGETVRLACLAPSGVTVRASVGAFAVPLAPTPANPTLHEGRIRLAAPAEGLPVTFAADGLGAAPAAALTARAAWPVQEVTGALFETRARSAPGDGDTVAFLTPGLRLRGAGFDGGHTRVWLGGATCFVDSRQLAPARQAQPLPPADLAPPDLAAGYPQRPAAGSAPRDLLILLDPGHGGASTGAVGPTGLNEKQAALEQARVIRATLEGAGFKVRMTRKGDTDPNLYARARLAYETRAAALISIHYNSCAASSDPSASRHIATFAWNAAGERLARALHPHLAAATPIPDRGVCQASFAVCRNPAVPSCLLELDFITCPVGEEALRQPERQRRVAEAVLAGLRDWIAAPAAP